MEDKIWDCIIVGTGMGGGPIGLRLAQAGLSVLFLEKGLEPSLQGKFAEEFPGDWRKNFRNAGRMSDPIYDCTGWFRKKLWPFMGSGVGGSSSLYGMVLERFQERDLQTWPLSFQEMERYYAEAEKLFGVSTASAPVHPGNVDLKIHFEKSGFRVDFLPLAHRTNPDCINCQSFQCQQNCKNHSGNICVERAVSQYGARLVTDVEVTKIVRASENKIRGVTALQNGVNVTFNAHQVILAAGALHTPLLLMEAEIGNQSGLVGRNLMRHFVDLYALKMDAHPEIFKSKEISIGLSPQFRTQSFGRLPPQDVLVHQLIRKNPILKWLQPLLKIVLQVVTRNRLVLATILEDKPHSENRVWKEDGKVCISYRIDSQDKNLISFSRKIVKRSVKSLGLLFISSAEKNEMLAHVCGTTKMGRHPATSVVDPNNRVHGLENLYVVDASFFPTSGSTNPALTIAANSLRVADQLLSQRRSR